MIDLTPAEEAALASRLSPLCLLIKMDLEETLYVTTAGVDVEWDEQLWLGVSMVGKVERINDSVGERSPLRFSLSGVPPDMLALALDYANTARGKRCTVYLAIHDPDTYQILGARQRWVGTIDQMPITVDDSVTITVVAEHIGVTFGRPKPVRYTDADQRQIYPDDKGLQFVVSQANKNDVWPSREAQK